MKTQKDTHTQAEEKALTAQGQERIKSVFKDNSALAVMLNVDNVLVTDLIIINERACKS